MSGYYREFLISVQAGPFINTFCAAQSRAHGSQCSHFHSTIEIVEAKVANWPTIRAKS